MLVLSLRTTASLTFSLVQLFQLALRLLFDRPDSFLTFMYVNPEINSITLHSPERGALKGSTPLVTLTYRINTTSLPE